MINNLLIKNISRVHLADGSTPLSVYGTLNYILLWVICKLRLVHYVVKELCADCILGLDFIHKYKLIINAEEQTVSICDNNKRITLKFDVNENNIRFPARLINSIRILPKHTVSVPVSVKLSSANVLFCPSFNLQRRSSITYVKFYS